MNRRLLTIAGAVAIALTIGWVSWLARYEPIAVPGEPDPWVLDRWTGRACLIRLEEVFFCVDLSAPTTYERWGEESRPDTIIDDPSIDSLRQRLRGER